MLGKARHNSVSGVSGERHRPIRASLIMVCVVSAITACIGIVKAREPLESFLPAEGLEKFIVAEFDIRTINSSVNPRRKTQQAKLADVGFRMTESSAGRAVLEGPDDTFVIEVLRRGDANNDAIEDVVVCLSESAKVGTLSSSRAFLLQKYSKSTPLIALANEVHDPKCR